MGIVPGVDGFTLGLKNETAALVYAPDACRIILFDPKPQQVRSLVDIVKEIDPVSKSICTIPKRSGQRGD